MQKHMLLLALLAIGVFAPRAKAQNIFITATADDPCKNDILWDAYESFTYTCDVLGIPLLEPPFSVLAWAGIGGSCSTIVLTQGSWSWAGDYIQAKMFAAAGSGENLSDFEICYPDPPPNGACVYPEAELILC